MPMDHTQRARRADALYHDDRRLNRRELCDMVAYAEAERDDLRGLATNLMARLAAAEDATEMGWMDAARGARAGDGGRMVTAFLLGLLLGALLGVMAVAVAAIDRWEDR